MKVIKFPNVNDLFINKNEKSIFVLGGFDAFHIGHMQLIDKVLSSKNDLLKSIIIIQNLENLPNNINSKIIFDLDYRLDILNNLGFDNVVLIDFNDEIKQLEPDKFIDMVVNNYNVSQFIVGEDYRLGKAAKWGAEELKKYFKNTTIVELSKIKNIKISSSLIKELIQVGEIKSANSLLVSPLAIKISIFSDLGFKIDPKETLIHPGIYATIFYIDNFIYHGLILIGMEDKNIVFFFNFKYQKPLIDIKIELISEIRLIIKESECKIKIEDIDKGKKNLLFYDNILKEKIRLNLVEKLDENQERNK